MLLFFSSTIFPLTIEEITDEDQKFGQRSSKVLPQSDSRSTPKKIKKNARKTTTKPPVWKKIDVPRVTYFCYQNTWINESNQPDLDKALQEFISDTTEQSMSTLHPNNIPSAIPTNKDHLPPTKLLKSKALTDKQDKHSDTQNILHRLAMINQKLINPWGPPVL